MPQAHPHSSAERWALVSLLGIALAARLPVWLYSHGATFDLDSYGLVCRHLLSGGRLYGDVALEGRYPYLPPWALILLALRGVSALTRLPEAMAFKLPGLLSDLAVTWALWRTASRLEPAAPAQPLARRAYWVTLAWAASPVAVLITAGHGQFDSLPLLCILLAAWSCEFSDHPASDRRAGWWLGAAVALKTWPLALLPAFLKTLAGPQERRAFALRALAPAALLALPFLLLQPQAFLKAAGSHFGSTGLGLSGALHAAAWLAKAPPVWLAQAQLALALLLLLGLAVLALLYLRGPWELPLFEGLALSVLLLYAGAPGLSAQYLLWLLPLALLLPPGSGLALRHQFLALAALLGFYLLFMPEAVLDARFPGLQAPPAWLVAAWGGFNLVLWSVYAVEAWRRLAAAARTLSPFSRAPWT